MLVPVVYAVAVSTQDDATLGGFLVCRLEASRAHKLVDASVIRLLYDVMKV